MVFVVWEFSKPRLLNNEFSKKGKCEFFAFRNGRGNSLQARAGWLGRKTSADTNYPGEDKREARFGFTFLWGNCVAQSRLPAAPNKYFPNLPVPSSLSLSQNHKPFTRKKEWFLNTENCGFNNLKEQDVVYDEKKPLHIFIPKLKANMINFFLLWNCLIKPGSFMDCTVRV